MKLFTTIISLAFCLPLILTAQIVPCGNTLQHALLSKKYPQYASLVDQAYKDAMAQNVTFRGGDTLLIPVVVHVVYNADVENVSDELIHGQIDVLNEDFNRLNADATNTRDIFLDVAGSPNIQFALTNKDPDGYTTTGITRTKTDVASFVNLDFALLFQAIIECGIDINDPESVNDNLDCLLEVLGGGFDLDAMKSAMTGGIDPWDVNRYLNIWVCNMSSNLGGQPTPFILGFAYPPVGAPNFPTEGLPENYWEKDGVVIHYEAFGRNNPNSGTLAGVSDLGRTATHEVGHYLGLRHIWGDGDCTEDDGLEDTPLAGSNSQATDLGDLPSCEELHQKDTCNDDTLPDMIENYMDYSLESCQNMFTVEQSNLMRAMLEGPRSGLLTGGFVSVDVSTVNPGIVLAPTMVSSILTVRNYTEGDATYRIIDNRGSLHSVGSLSAKQSIDVSTLGQGIYYLQVNQGGKLSVHKFVKTN